MPDLLLEDISGNTKPWLSIFWVLALDMVEFISLLASWL